MQRLRRLVFVVLGGRSGREQARRQHVGMRVRMTYHILKKDSLTHRDEGKEEIMYVYVYLIDLRN